MKRNHWFARLSGLMLVSAALLTAALAATPGTEDDPLVTLSYLNDTFLPQMLSRVDERLAAQGLSNGLTYQTGQNTQSGDSFTVVTLSDGQTLYGEVGCEAMLRVGSAVCVSPSNPGLIDSTSGGVIHNGAALTQNHLYLMTIEGRGIRAGSGTTKLMIRGNYSII